MGVSNIWFARRLTAGAALAGLALSLAACGGTPIAQEGSPTTSSIASPSVTAPATIETVWQSLACKTNDVMGTLGILESGDAPVEQHGSCRPYEDGGTVFFFQLPTPSQAVNYLRSGALDIGAKEAVFVERRVIMITSDAVASSRLAEQFKAYQ
ncbi:hypothetical protein GH740_11520 [Microbacterium sp. SYP-A9085]|uniref:hypothetical protein n=1 Tax=Microbacterium sp. SYP-A9085 TaxID=2664454 RepID=UPI00129BFF5D|nr:hypothetical protein [Microbacterium sp. SYP-A9085]MRH29931.1 hypothetical protein [Microbacterium sp. SYP-A9085]